MKTRASLRGFTLTELLVTIVIIAILAALSGMLVSRLKESARKAASTGNLRQVGVAVNIFVSENNGFLPASRSSKGIFWPELVFEHVGSVTPYLIPNTPDRPMDAKVTPVEGYFPLADKSAMTPEGTPIRWNYTINGGHSKLVFSELSADGKPMPGLGRGYSRPFTQVKKPGRTVMMAEGTSWWLNASAKPNSDRIRRWSNGTANILWCDGRVSLEDPAELEQSDFHVSK
ncbi:MAG: type II secretion system GspH family protein [Akkermansiaceae bacterium]|jgi:prepilin-type N-terminal cleavage/methylation domain-containing protein/prepilin-type processing-associated H-X9-DG protein|nr:type II secretion system GspH family protein [Akkermansiaceae bacterium]